MRCNTSNVFFLFFNIFSRSSPHYLSQMDMTAEGRTYSERYQVQDYPHLAIIDVSVLGAFCVIVLSSFICDIQRANYSFSTIRINSPALVDCCGVRKVGRKRNH